MHIACLLSVALSLGAAGAPAVPPSQRPISSDYQITINGTPMDLALDKELTYKTPSGELLTITVHRKDIASYNDQFVTFAYPSQLSVAKSLLGEGINQLLLTTATGTLVMIQEYDEIDPTSMVDALLNELIKDDIKAGWHCIKSIVTQKTADGHECTGKQAVLTYGGQKTTMTVVAFNKEDRGVVVVTSLDKDYVDTDGNMVVDFWKSLVLHY